MTDNVKQLASYLKLPEQKTVEFWNHWRINHIRNLAQTGKSDGEIFTPQKYRTLRSLDKIKLKVVTSPSSEVPDTSAVFTGNLRLSAPVYLGDMSFGALSGVPNIAIARTADSMNVVAGTGEGGLLPEIENSRNITVQWASARFGVTAEKLRRGAAIVIKVGQGAKPGIGGHLPGSKVTPEISEARSIPVGIDAISPAPHHDIYSIEDLGRRINMLKILTGKPVLVKVAATNYIPYIASGIARMGGAGIIIDGFGAGTGAAPNVIRDNFGMPIEKAVQSAHQALVKEGLRENFQIIAGGRVSTPEDMVKLICLGADFVTLGTAVLIAMGCLMVHKCHHGSCPVLLTNKLSDRRAPLSIAFAKRSLERFISGWIDETKALLSQMGAASLAEIRGREDMLVFPEDNVEVDRLHIARDVPSRLAAVEITESENITGQEERTLMLSGLAGKKPSHPPITSMGSSSDPSLGKYVRATDHLIIDGAQVTRPSMDPHREVIDTTWIPVGGAKASLPSFITISRGTSREGELRDAASAMSIPILSDGEIILENWRSRVETIPSNRQIADKVPLLIEDGVQFVEVSESVETSDLPLEASVSILDTFLRQSGLRSRIQILATPNRMRGSEDIAKIMCLGANSVSINPLISLIMERGGKREHIENLISGIRREIKLISGSAGIGLFSNSFTGNREILRSVSLGEAMREVLDVKEAGA